MNTLRPCTVPRRAPGQAARRALLAGLFSCSWLAGCAREEPHPAPAHAIRAMHLDEAKTSTIDFETAHAKGRIEILSGVKIGYVSVTSGTGEASSTRISLTIQDKPFSFEGPELRIGERSFGPLAGEVQVRIGPEGVFVGAEKRGEL